MWESRNCCTLFHVNFSTDLVEIRSAAMTCWSVQAHTVFSRMISSQRSDLSFSDFEENMFKTGLCLDTCKSISFKFGMMQDAPEHFDTTLYDDGHD